MLFSSNDEKPIFIFYMYFVFREPKSDEHAGRRS